MHEWRLSENRRNLNRQNADGVSGRHRRFQNLYLEQRLKGRARYRFDRSRTEWTLQLDGEIVAQVDTDGHVSEIDLKAIVRLNPPLRSDSSAS